MEVKDCDGISQPSNRVYSSNVQELIPEISSIVRRRRLTRSALRTGVVAKEEVVWDVLFEAPLFKVDVHSLKRIRK